MIALKNIKRLHSFQYNDRIFVKGSYSRIKKEYLVREWLTGNYYRMSSDILVEETLSDYAKCTVKFYNHKTGKSLTYKCFPAYDIDRCDRERAICLWTTSGQALSGFFDGIDYIEKSSWIKLLTNDKMTETSLVSVKNAALWFYID